MHPKELFADVTRDDLLTLFDILEHQEPPCSGTSCERQLFRHSEDCAIETIIRLMNFTNLAITEYEEVHCFTLRVYI